VDDLTQIRDTISDLLSKKQPVLVAIDGYGGSGKTTLAQAIQSAFRDSATITLDDFATDTESGADRNRFLSQVLLPLSNGTAAKYQPFDWRIKALADWRVVQPEGLIIIEGVSVVWDDFHPFYDFRVWIDCPFELALQRVRERSQKTGIHKSSPKWFNVWEKEDREYGKTEPWKRADLVIRVPGSKEL
jgi:uridine kinase